MQFVLDELRGEQIRALLQAHRAGALPFGDYRVDPHRLFMTRRVDVAEPAA